MRGAVVALLVLAVAAGCGGGGTRLSQAEFRQRANAACAELSRRGQALPGEAKDEKQARALARRATDILADAADDLESLEPPASLERTYDEFVRTVGRARDFFRENEERIARVVAGRGRGGDEARLEREGEPIFKRLGRLAKQLRLARCAEALSTG